MIVWLNDAKEKIMPIGSLENLEFEKQGLLKCSTTIVVFAKLID